MKKQVLFVLLVGALVLSACIVPIQRPATDAPVATVTTPAATEAVVESDQTAAFGAAWESVDCATFGVAPELAEKADCGYVTVPENRAAGSDATIQLAVVRVRSDAAQPGAPMLVGTGGPGGAGMGDTIEAALQIFNQAFDPILADRDVVRFSQRGTKYAIPDLSCPAYDAAILEAVKQELTVDERRANQLEAIQACVADFKARGVDLTAFNSVENAADVNAIREALGYDKIIYYGESYGTLLGQFLMRAHPKILEAIILDGIAPASATRWSDVTNFAQAFERVFDACAADDACNAAYPNLEETLTKALADMKANPPRMEFPSDDGGTISLKIDDLTAMNALFIYLYVAGGYSLLPKAIYQMAEGNYDALKTTIPIYFGVSGDVAKVQHLTMVCSDDPLTSLEELNLEGVPDIYRSLIEDDAIGYADYCPMLNLPQLPDSSDELVKSEIPVLLLQGGLDPATPVSGGNKLVAGLPNSYNVIVPAGSHIQKHSPCIATIIASFMNDPKTQPDTSCVDQSVPFALP